MRRVFLIVSALLFCSVLNSQHKFPFPDSAASWDDITQYSDNSPFFRNDIIRYEMIGDTTINGKKYSKLCSTLRAGFYNVASCGYSFYSEPKEQLVYRGAIRTDSLQRVFYKSINKSDDYKIYDFSASLHDTILIGSDASSYKVIVRKVDSVLIQNTYRKRFILDYPPSETWIEGIGSTLGLLSTYFQNQPGTNRILLCFKQDSVSVYSHYSDYDAEHCGIDFCSFETYFNVDVNTTRYDDPIIQIFPNPIIDVSRISYSEGFRFVQIYNIMGRLVRTYPFNGKSIKIHKSDFNPGFYTVVVIADDNSIYQQKVVIH